NAPSPELEQRYVAAAAARRQRGEGTRAGVESMAPRPERPPAPETSGPFPADLAQQLAALRAAGFKDVDCFWEDLRRALFGGYAWRPRAALLRSRRQCVVPRPPGCSLAA